MNIDDLTIGELKQLQGLIGGKPSNDSDTFLQGKYVIVRTYSAGVFAGTLEGRQGNKILLSNCRRLWRWATANGGISLSEIAVYGLKESDSKICVTEDFKVLEDIEISPCTAKSEKCIKEAKEYVTE